MLKIPSPEMLIVALRWVFCGLPPAANHGVMFAVSA